MLTCKHVAKNVLLFTAPPRRIRKTTHCMRVLLMRWRFLLRRTNKKIQPYANVQARRKRLYFFISRE